MHNNMKLTSLIIVLFLSLTATAQKSSNNDGLKIGLAGGANFTTLGTDGFNNKIPNNLPELKNTVFSFIASFDLFQTDEPLYTNISFASTLRKAENSGVRLEENLVFGDVNICYAPIMKESRYLFGGLGLGQMTYSAAYFSDQPNMSFSGAALAPVGERSFRLKPMYYINLKAGFVQSISKKLPFSLGLEGGYRIGLNNREWSLYGNSLNNSPTMNASGPFASLSIYVLDHFKR